MAYYNECPLCGAALDPCEKCNCDTAETDEERRYITSEISKIKSRRDRLQSCDNQREGIEFAAI